MPRDSGVTPVDGLVRVRPTGEVWPWYSPSVTVNRKLYQVSGCRPVASTLTVLSLPGTAAA